MKTAMIFVGLKIVEGLGLCAVFYWFYWIGGIFNEWRGCTYLEKWWEQLGTGIWIHGMAIGLVAILFGISLGIWKLLKKNIEWAKKWG